MPRKGYGKKRNLAPSPHHSRAELVYEEAPNKDFRLALECPHGRWSADFQPSMNPAIDMRDPETMVTCMAELTMNLVMLHDQGGHPVRCVRRIRLPGMPEPAVVEPAKVIHRPIFALADDTQMLLIDRSATVPGLIRVRTLCDHTYCELLVQGSEVEAADAQEEGGGPKYLWAQLQECVKLHTRETGCQCFHVPSLDEMLRLIENSLLHSVLHADEASHAHP